MTQTLDLSSVQPGFDDPVLDAQACFRKILDAMSRPGRVVNLDVTSAPELFNLASAGLALTLLDFDTPVFLSQSLRSDAVTSWLRFHCTAQITSDPKAASFAFLASGDEWPALDHFNQGDAKYPDLSTSLVILLPSLDDSAGVSLEGPGIKTAEIIKPAGLPASFWDDRAENVADFQLGVDCYLTAENRLIGLPRTTRTTQI